MEIIVLVLKIAVTLVLLSILYRLTPYKKLSDKKPVFSFFPKYKFAISDRKMFEEKADELGFTQAGDTLVRGKYWGDFNIKWAKLSIKSDDQNGYLQSPLVVILFDTGDLWKIADSLSN
jgi:hypothetical protein